MTFKWKKPADGLVDWVDRNARIKETALRLSALFCDQTFAGMLFSFRPRAMSPGLNLL